MEERVEIKQVLVKYKCPKCKTGYLEGTGVVFTTNPPFYPHRCNNPKCDYGEEFMGICYPHTEYEEVKKKRKAK